MSDCTDRHRYVFIFAASTSAVGACAVASALCFKGAGMTKIDQRVDVAITNQIDTTTIASVATIGSAPRNIFFATETQAAVAAISGNDFYFYFIDEFHYENFPGLSVMFLSVKF